MIAVLEADHYREEEARLKTDPIILAMFEEMVGDPRADEAAESTSFVGLALDEYDRRGGKGAGSIGGPARAIRALLKERRSHEDDPLP